MVVHDDGTLRDEHRALYARHFEGVRVLDDGESSAQMAEHLSPWPTCRRFRARADFYCARKLFDLVFLAESEHADSP